MAMGRANFVLLVCVLSWIIWAATAYAGRYRARRSPRLSRGPS